MNLIICPRCDSKDILVYEENSYWINTGEHFCHSVKTHDPIAKVKCITCGWEGVRTDVDSQGDSL